MQWFGVWWKRKWIAIIVTSILFGLLHGANAEVEVIGWSSMIFYIGFGLFMAIITTMDNGLELALGFHWATNFFGVAIVSNTWGTAQTDTLLKDLSEPSAGEISLYISTGALVFIYILFAKMYKWKSIITLFDKVELPESDAEQTSVESEMAVYDV